MIMDKYKTGDIVKVWSLQSFSDGGFINGREGIVAQDQIGVSVLVCVQRKISGEERIDPSYEVYAEQLKLVKRTSNKTAMEKFKCILAELRKT